MTTTQFEQAIDALSAAGPTIIIDEMVLDKGHVTAVYGHTRKAYLSWDGFGRAFSISTDVLSGAPLPERPIENRGPVDVMGRAEAFDLKFK